VRHPAEAARAANGCICCQRQELLGAIEAIKGSRTAYPEDISVSASTTWPSAYKFTAAHNLSRAEITVLGQVAVDIMDKIPDHRRSRLPGPFIGHLVERASTPQLDRARHGRRSVARYEWPHPRTGLVQMNEAESLAAREPGMHFSRARSDQPVGVLDWAYAYLDLDPYTWPVGGEWGGTNYKTHQLWPAVAALWSVLPYGTELTVELRRWPISSAACSTRSS